MLSSGRYTSVSQRKGNKNTEEVENIDAWVIECDDNNIPSRAK